MKLVIKFEDNDEELNDRCIQPYHSASPSRHLKAMNSLSASNV